VREIARGLGFLDAGHFTQLVKARFGLTPTAIRSRAWVG